MHWYVRGLSCKPNIYVSWSTSELWVRLAPLNRFKPSSKIFYWPFQGGTSFVDLLCFCSVLCLLCFVRVCLYVLRGHLLGKGWPLGSRLWCLLWVCHFPIGILGQVWYLIVSIPDLCNHTYFDSRLKGLLEQISKGAKIRNRYNQVRHLTQDTNGKVTNSWLDTTKESQEVSPFPGVDHKAHIKRCAQSHNKHKTEKKHKRSTKEVPPWNGQ